MKISVVSPVFEAEECIAELCRRLKTVLVEISGDFEIILVDDGSSDRSWSRIQAEAASDPRVYGVRLAKNFGQHRAISAGLDLARGDWVVVMDCDLQDPPEVIPQLIDKALEGHDIVLARFDQREESFLRQVVSKMFWTALSSLAGFSFDHKAGNFRVMSRKVVESFRLYKEQLRFLGGITSLMGFAVETVSVAREQRFGGKSSYSVSKLISLGVEVAVAYSDKPLRISVSSGLLMAMGALVAGSIFLFLGLGGAVEVPGWVSVIVSLYLLGGFMFANLGVIGIYLGKVFDESKQRPLYIVAEKCSMTNLSSGEDSSHDSGAVVWITGLSGAGKTTLARDVVSRLKNQGFPSVFLDGDEIRDILGLAGSSSENHQNNSRLSLAKRYSALALLLSSQGHTVVVATISLFQEVHAWNRQQIPNYFEVYLKVPISELRRRDPKGIYAMQQSGKISNVAGIDLEVHEPECPDRIFEFDSGEELSEVSKEIVSWVIGRNQR